MADRSRSLFTYVCRKLSTKVITPRSGDVSRTPIFLCVSNLNLSVQEGTAINGNVKAFKEELLETLGTDNVVLIYHHGNRTRGEARPDSDYDTILVLQQIDEEAIQKVRTILSRHPTFQVYLLSLSDFNDLPPGQRLQFFEGSRLHGNLDLNLPSREQVLGEIRRSRLESLHYLRHYLTLPHDKERKARLVYFQLKDAYFYLKRIAYYATGELVPTRKELVLKLKELPVDLFLSTEILQSLESYEENKARIVNNPDGYLLKLERFFRTTRL